VIVFDFIFAVITELVIDRWENRKSKKTKDKENHEEA
jgi:hypothetical protein